jgi:hypothetical protein
MSWLERGADEALFGGGEQEYEVPPLRPARARTAPRLPARMLDGYSCGLSQKIG